MRSILRVLVAVTSILTVLSPAIAGSASSARSGPADLATVEQYLYRTPISSFVAAAPSGDRWFDWSNDGCSAPLVGNTGRSFDFTAACKRHDFGYRNLKLLEQRYGSGRTYWNATNRLRVDRQFLSDMRRHCTGRRWYDEPTCNSWALTFYGVVRVVGGP
jgi:hypothetical protein